MNDITVYSTNTCPYCTMMKNFLDDKGLAYKEVNVQLDQQAAQKLVEETGQMGVPQTKINGNWVLGFDPESLLSFVK
ncbi:glutaredoxin family protein [Bacillus massiliigorillae]|uniref:glutaredoxin family protein n=1 Tax=Bacillus massiliigorillae TaxID=1243664 RepID=UPI0003A7B1B4|nr:glutaredoxin family protein [Bacillus massiliigorillae]